MKTPQMGAELINSHCRICFHTDLNSFMCAYVFYLIYRFLCSVSFSFYALIPHEIHCICIAFGVYGIAYIFE